MYLIYLLADILQIKTPNQSVNSNATQPNIMFRFTAHYRKLPPTVPMGQNVSTESMFEGLATEV